MNIKKILAIALALVGGWILLKVLWWILGMAFTIAFTIIQIVVVLALAVPLYLIISRKLLK
jgi:hypothetical protein